MKKINCIKTAANSWGLLKPNRSKHIRSVAPIFTALFAFCVYVVTKGFTLNNPLPYLRNISMPFVPIGGAFMYHWFRYEQNVDIHIQSLGNAEFIINEVRYTLDGSQDYIAVTKYGNRFGTALYSIELVIKKKKAFIGRNIFEEEYNEIIQSLSPFLKLNVRIFG